MTTIPELLHEHVSLEVECVDRVYLNGYVPRLQTSGALVYFLERHRGELIASPASLGQIGQTFVGAVESFAREQNIPMVRFQKGQRKDDIVASYRRKFQAQEGVVVIGVAQEQVHSFKGRKETFGRNGVRFQFSRQSVFVKVYYFYVQDAAFGPGFIKVATYMPYPVKVCLNGHEWAKQQLRQAGVAFEALDNGFLSCADPERVQAVCQALGPEQVQAFFEKWVARLPWPLTEADRTVGYRHRLSIWQLEVSRTHVFTRPMRGREFFEQSYPGELGLGPARPGATHLWAARPAQHAQPLHYTSCPGRSAAQSASDLQAFRGEAILQGKPGSAHGDDSEQPTGFWGGQGSVQLELSAQTGGGH
jgi:hypothetical protein